MYILLLINRSAASMSTDLYGMAVLDACEQILSRLQPIREQLRIQLNLGILHPAVFLTCTTNHSCTVFSYYYQMSPQRCSGKL